MEFSVSGIFKTKLRVFAVVAVLVIAAVALLAKISLHTVPSGYRPEVLASGERRSAAADFNSAVMDVLGAASMVGSRDRDGSRGPESTVVSFSQKQINQWLAALDEDVITTMADMGFAQPAIQIGDGTLTLHALWQKKSMVVSVELAPGFDQRGRMLVEINRVALGSVKLPDSWLNQRKGELIRRLEDKLASARASGRQKIGPLPADDGQRALNILLDCARGRRIELDFPSRYGKASVDNIVFDNGQLTMHIRSRLSDEPVAKLPQ